MNKGEREDAKNYFDVALELLATETKSNIETVASNLESSIEGKFSKAVQNEVEKVSESYASLSGD